MITKEIPINIEVNPSTRPRIPLVVAFPGDVVVFTVEHGEASIVVPRGNQIFDGFDSGNELSLDSDNSSRRLMVRKVVIPEDLPRGALVVKYSVACWKDGETYFAEGDSPPKIIIPPRRP